MDSTLPWEGGVKTAEQWIQVVFHVLNKVFEAGIRQLFCATCLFVKQSKQESDIGILGWWNALCVAPCDYVQAFCSRCGWSFKHKKKHSHFPNIQAS